MISSTPFWEAKSFHEMTLEEWESLCDGCAKCCLFKIEDAETGAINFTDIACRLLDVHICRCKVYEHRSEIVKDCTHLTPEMVHQVSWLPESCAYRRLLEGRGLARWHPLISGNRDSVHQANVSILGPCRFALSVVASPWKGDMVPEALADGEAISGLM